MYQVVTKFYLEVTDLMSTDSSLSPFQEVEIFGQDYVLNELQEIVHIPDDSPVDFSIKFSHFTSFKPKDALAIYIISFFSEERDLIDLIKIQLEEECMEIL